MRMIKSILLPLGLFFLAATPVRSQELLGSEVYIPDNMFVNNTRYNEGSNNYYLTFSKADGKMYLTLHADNKNKFFPIDKYGSLTFQYTGGDGISLPVTKDFEIMTYKAKWSETLTNHRVINS